MAAADTVAAAHSVAQQIIDRLGRIAELLEREVRSEESSRRNFIAAGTVTGGALVGVVPVAVVKGNPNRRGLQVQNITAPGAPASYDSLTGSGRVVTPLAGAAIATTPAGVAGDDYDIYVSVSVGAGATAGDDGNMQLQEGGTVLDVLAVPAPGGIKFGPLRRTNVGGAAYSVNAVAAGTALVPYSASIIATRVPSAGSSGGSVSLGLGTTAPQQNAGITLAPGQTWDGRISGRLWLGSVSIVATAAGTAYTWLEG